VDSRSGWKTFFFSSAIAGVLGLSVQLHFSPDRVKAIVTEAIQGQKFQITFDSAELKLARGPIPLFAIQITNIELSPDRACAGDPPLKIAQVTVPFRFLDLLLGRVAVGTVNGADLVVDLDRIKSPCGDEDAGAKGGHSPLSEALSGRPVMVAASKKGESKAGARWWTEGQLKGVQELFEGFYFSRVELLFERKTKKVYLEDFSARTSEGEDFVEVSTDLRLSPEVTFGETLPPLSVEIKASAESADVNVDARLSEGSLDLLASLRPLEDGGVDIDAQASVSNLPLSTMVPLLVKSGIANSKFKPHFLWLNCEAEIKGRFQGLFESSPLKLSRCAVEGGGSRIAMEQATRLPGGSWAPMQIQIQNLDLRRTLETFSAEGPAGIADEFGRLSGQLEIRNKDDARFEGAIEGIGLRFSKRNVRVGQRITRLELTGELRGDRIKGEVNRIAFDKGEFDGELKFDGDRKFERGEARLRVRKLAFHPQVGRLLVAGEIGPMSGELEGQFVERNLAGLTGEIKVAAIDGAEVRAKDLRIKPSFDGTQFGMTVRAPALELAQGATFLQSLEPLFFAHEIGSEWVRAQDLSLEGGIHADGEFKWDRLQTTLEGGRIQMQSAGTLSRERQLSGWVSVDFPLVKRVRWALAGHFPRAEFKPDSKVAIELSARTRVDESALGLQPVTRIKATAQEARATRALRELGEKVVQKARRIVPGVRSEGSEAAQGAQPVAAPPN
jgi:hypothetical protein